MTRHKLVIGVAVMATAALVAAASLYRSQDQQGSDSPQEAARVPQSVRADTPSARPSSSTRSSPRPVSLPVDPADDSPRATARKLYAQVGDSLSPADRDQLFASLRKAQEYLVPLRGDCMAGQIVDDILQCSEVIVDAVKRETASVRQELQQALDETVYADIAGSIDRLVVASLLEPFDPTQPAD